MLNKVKVLAGHETLITCTANERIDLDADFQVMIIFDYEF